MSNNKVDNNTEMEIPVFETPPGPGSSAIKVEPKEENCEDLLSAFLLDPPPVKIENEVKGEDLDEFGTLSEDYTVNIEQLKAEHSEDSKDWLNKHPLKSEEKEQLAVGEDQDDDFVEHPSNIIKSEEMDIKEDESINEPGILPNTNDQVAKKRRKHLQTYDKRGEGTTQTMFGCDQCDIKSKYKHDARDHSLLQHGISVNSTQPCCPESDYTTIRKDNLNIHLPVHRKPEDVPLFKCGHCNYQTVLRSKLINHLYWHRKKSEKAMLFKERLRLNWFKLQLGNPRQPKCGGTSTDSRK